MSSSIILLTQLSSFKKCNNTKRKWEGEKKELGKWGKEKLDALSVKTNCQINPHFKAGSFKENLSVG